ncbi:multimerin-2-like [Saccostrea cucullata]|uniref:multimerin-2-like n=1 Tax=Saccostrea cuccullata TaxID=36930 RepID=UPI002ED30F2D
MLRMEDKNGAKDKAGSRIERLFEARFKKENQDLKRKVLQLEENLHNSNAQMDNVKTIILELLSTNRELNARITALENSHDRYEKKKNINTMFGGSIKKSTSATALSKENSDEFSSSSSITKGQIFLEAQQNFTMTETKNQPTILKSNPFQNKTFKEKRLLTGVHTTKPPFADGVAFSAFVSALETDISKDHTIKFDSIVTNIGNHYNPHSGIFTAPQHGAYVFTWNIYCNHDNYIYSQVVVNSNAVAAIYTSGKGATNVRTTTGVVVVEVNQGDVVFVRTHPTQAHSGNLYSGSSWRSSFNGWKIY